MKLRLLVVAFTFPVLLAACSMAEDITPPPDYTAATAAPVVEVVYPSTAPSVQNGAEIYAIQCASCHGATGLGNGSMSDQMPVAVPAIGLREISSQATPADWYLVLTQGSVSRGMPAYADWNVADRWDVLAYTYSLSTSVEQIQAGAALFAETCAECHGAAGDQNPSADFTDPAFLAQRSGTSMYRQVSEGGATMPEFGSLLTEGEIYSLTDYIRSLSFGGPIAVAAEPAPIDASAAVTSEPVPGATDVPVADAEVTPEPETVLLAFTGDVRNALNTALESNLIVTLHQYDMATGLELDPIVETVAADATFQFTDIPATVGSQIAYWVDLVYAGVPYQSDFVTYDGTSTVFELPVTVYESTTDYSGLNVSQVDVYLLFDTAGTIQVYEMYNIVNPGPQTVVFSVADNTIAFIGVPEGAENIQFSPGGTSAPFLSATDGAAMIPGADLIYSIVTVFTLPYEKRLTVDIPFILPATKVEVYVEDGIKVKSKSLTEIGPTAVQEINLVQYETTDVAADGIVSLTVSGSVSTGETPVLDQRLIIGIGAAGILLIGAGIFLFIRERKRSREEEEMLDEDEEGEDALGDDPDEIMDAIIALDEQYKAGGISKEAYEQRREELKARLKK